MYPSRRRPLNSTTSSFTSFSSDNSYIPTYRRSSPTAIRQLIVRDLADTDSTDRTRSSQIPKANLPIPRPLIHIPREQVSWTTDRRHLHEEQEGYPSSANRIVRTPVSERPFYQIVRPVTSPPFPPPPPPPLPPPTIQYQIVPVPTQRYIPIRTLRRIKRKKYIKERTPGLCATLCSGGFATVAALIYILIALALPIAKLVLGIIHVNNCNVNQNIPLYMIISGACGLSIVLFLLLSSTCSLCRSTIIARKTTHQLMIGTIAISRGMQGVLAIFLFVWFFFGNVWVFGARQRVQTNRPGNADYCDPGLYWLAFYVLVFTYIYAAFVCIMKFCTTFLCCGACDIWKRAFS